MNFNGFLYIRLVVALFTSVEDRVKMYNYSRENKVTYMLNTIFRLDFNTF